MERVTPVEEVSDQEWIARFRNGDETAFNQLVLRHQQRAFNLAYQVVRNHEDAVEVAQDAFVSVYRHIDQFRGDCAFTTWLHQIVMNLARNKHRWWKRRGRPSSISLDAPLATADGTLDRQLAAPDDPPDQTAVNVEFVDQIARAMAGLPLKFREVLVLRNIEELSYEEIATVLRCSVGTVKSRIARAREALRAQLKGTE